MKRISMIVLLGLTFSLILAAPAMAHTVTASDTDYSSSYGNVTIKGYSRVSMPAENTVNGYISTNAFNSTTGYSYKPYYIKCSGTLTARFLSQVVWKTYTVSLFASDTGNDVSGVSDSDSASANYPNGNDGYVKATHSFKKYSGSSTVSCYTQTARVGHN